MQTRSLGGYLGPRTFVISRSPQLERWPDELVKGRFKPMCSSSPYRAGLCAHGPGPGTIVGSALAGEHQREQSTADPRYGAEYGRRDVLLLRRFVAGRQRVRGKPQHKFGTDAA